MKQLTIYILAAATLWSCERDTETLGPNLDDKYGEFQVFEDFDVSSTQADFSTGDFPYFTARFSKSVDWQVEVIGRSSGARKLLSDRSNIVDQENATWNGTTTDLPMFKTEVCDAIISVEAENYTDTIFGINIDSTRVNEGFVVADFENGINPGWNIFVQSGGDMKFNIEESDSAAQGFHFYDMGGEVNFDYLIGYIYFPASAYQEPYFPLSNNPDVVYFNVFLGKPELINNEIILFQFTEDDNGDGIFQEGSEDMYSLELKNISSNWDHINMLYSDLTALVNGAPAEPAGNGVHEPDKLLEVRVLFLADPNSGYSQSYMDYMIFTENAPLQP